MEAALTADLPTISELENVITLTIEMEHQKIDLHLLELVYVSANITASFFLPAPMS